MDMQQIIEMLARMDANQAKADANTKTMNEMKDEIN
jgi:hypothetical protein